MNITYLVSGLGMFLFVVMVGALAMAWSRRQLQPGSDQVLLASEPDRAKDVMVRLARGRPVLSSDSAFVTAHLLTTRQTRIPGLILGGLGVALLVLGVVMVVQQGPLWGACVATLVAALLHLLMTVLGVGLYRQHARLRRNAAAQGFPLP